MGKNSASHRQLVNFSFLDRNHGWAILDYNLHDATNGMVSYVFLTMDGGKTWNRQVDDALLTGPAFWVNFLTDRLGFVFLDGKPDHKQSKADEFVPTLLYTTDAGAHWQKIVLPNVVSGSQAFQGDLLCSAQGDGPHLRLLRIHPR